MVLNRADFGKSFKSLQTPSNAVLVLENGFLIPYRTICVDLG